MTTALKHEFEYYLRHQLELVEKYNGKFVVIKGDELLGVYNDQAAAILESQKTNELGTFLVQKVEPGTSAYTQTFHTRVA